MFEELMEYPNIWIKILRNLGSVEFDIVKKFEMQQYYSKQLQYDIMLGCLKYKFDKINSNNLYVVRYDYKELFNKFLDTFNIENIINDSSTIIKFYNKPDIIITYQNMVDYEYGVKFLQHLELLQTNMKRMRQMRIDLKHYVVL